MNLEASAALTQLYRVHVAHGCRAGLLALHRHLVRTGDYISAKYILRFLNFKSVYISDTHYVWHTGVAEFLVDNFHVTNYRYGFIAHIL